MSRALTDDERQYANHFLQKARAAMRAIDHYDQGAVDRLCRAVAWATYNEPTAKRLANMSVDESGLGDREPRRRAKIMPQTDTFFQYLLTLGLQANSGFHRVVVVNKDTSDALKDRYSRVFSRSLIDRGRLKFAPQDSFEQFVDGGGMVQVATYA